MINIYATKPIFENAHIGATFLNVCSSCGEEDGTLAIKTHGKATEGKKLQSNLPKYLPSELCEACKTLELLILEKVVEGDLFECEIAKLVDEEGELIAWVPFNRSIEPPTITLAEEKVLTLKHKTVITCQIKEEDASAISVKEEGISLSKIKEVREAAKTFQNKV